MRRRWKEREAVKRSWTDLPERTLQDCPVDLDEWLEGFHDTEASVRRTVAAIAGHPLMPSDVSVRGFIIDSATGALTEIE